MIPALHVSALADHQLALALPLMQITWPDLDLAAWRDFAASLRGEGGGLLVLTEGEYICGVLAYRRLAGLFGAVLSVPLFTVADLANRPGVAQALAAAAENIREQMGCRSVRFDLHPSQSRLAARLRDVGALQP